jgi:CheY-like chemotaxis protein
MVLEATDDEQARHDVEQVIKAGKRARDLVRQILAFGRYSEGSRAVADLRETVREAVKLLRASIPTTVDIQVDYSDHALPVAADPTHIHQIVLNLGTNAYHAMLEEGGILHVEVDTVEVAAEVADRNPGVRPGVFARIVVSDTGRGMPADVLARIYEPFYTTKEVGKGTGLGLSVVHGIVTALNGFIQAYSAVGEGSRFEIYFPLSEDATGEEESADIDVVGGEEHILVVDDDPDIAEMLRRLLGSVGYQVKAETDSRRALERVRSGEEVDLVLTDQTMPNLTGVEMARRLRHIRPGLPILLITGYGDTLEAGELRESGIARMLMKPVVPGRLEQAIRETLREARFRGGTHGEDPGDRG